MPWTRIDESFYSVMFIHSHVRKSIGENLVLGWKGKEKTENVQVLLWANALMVCATYIIKGKPGFYQPIQHRAFVLSDIDARKKGLEFCVEKIIPVLQNLMFQLC